MSWQQAVGVNVAAVRAALHNLETGDGDYQAVKNAVAGAKFAVRPTALTLDELADNWDYQPMPDTATDTIQAALFTRTLTMEQYSELMNMAQYTGPERSRVPGPVTP
jgi:hypothetical protein